MIMDIIFHINLITNGTEGRVAASMVGTTSPMCFGSKTSVLMKFVSQENEKRVSFFRSCDVRI